MIGIIDYSMGNLASVKNAIGKIGWAANTVSDPDRLKYYDRLILPGVGAFGDAMEHLEKTGLKEAVIEYAKSGAPLVGICLGMQLLFEKSSEFGEHSGLGLMEGEVVLFDKERLAADQKIPQMGWNKMYATQDSVLFAGLPEEIYLYFVHSFHALPKNKQDIIGETQYGYRFASAVHRENLFGFQPHPEKSHDAGLQILNNFLKL